LRVAPFARFRGLPPVYWRLFAATLVDRIGGFVSPLFAFYLTQARGLSAAYAGFVIALYNVGSVASVLVGGALADRIGRRPTMLAGWILGPLAMLALAFARSTSAIVWLSLSLGCFSSIHRPAVAAMVADVVRPEDRIRAFGYLYWVVNVGFAVASTVAGLVASLRFEAIFVADAATTLVCATLVAVSVPESMPSEKERAKEAPKNLGFFGPFRSKTFTPFLVLCFLLGCVFLQFQAAMPIDMRAHGIDARKYGALMALNGVVVVLLQPFAVHGMQRFDRARLLAVGSLLIGLGFGLNAFAHTVPFYALAIIVWTLGEVTHAPVASAIVADLSPVDQRGRYQGAFSVTWGLAGAAGPALGGVVLHRYGATILWEGCVLLGAIVAIGHLWAGAARRKLAHVSAPTTAL